MSVFNRPGVSDDFLARAGCHRVSADECVNLYGCRAEGIAIPFRSLDARAIVDDEKPFARVRLDAQTDSQKYHQRAGSGTHIYIPPNFREQPRGSTLVLTEGEFKALALTESRFAAIGLPGIHGAIQKGDGQPRLHPELVEVLEFHQPARVLFLGDSDVVLNSDFAREASKLRKLLFDSKRFAFTREFRVAVCPLNGRKGVDDVRGAMGDEFNSWFTSLVQGAFGVPAKSSPAQIFCALLKREDDPVRAALTSGDDHDQHHIRVKLLQSAGRLQNEPGVMLLLRPLLTDLFNVKDGELNRMIKDAGGDRNQASNKAAKENVQSSQASVVEPWDKPVDGKELLDELRANYRRFMVLPPQADVLLSVWTMHTYLFDEFSYTPYLHVTSPEKECGKSTLGELMNHLCANATTPGGMSAASMFRRIERVRPTLLLDEWDTLSDENRQAALNILNTGFKWNGVYTICVGDEHQDRDFHTFCPKAIFGLSEKKLPVESSP